MRLTTQRLPSLKVKPRYSCCYAEKGRLSEYLHSPAAIRGHGNCSQRGYAHTLIYRQSHLLDFSRRSDDVSDLRLDEIIDDAAELMSARKIHQEGHSAGIGRSARALMSQGLAWVVTNLGAATGVHESAGQLPWWKIATPGWGTITMGCSVKDGTAMAYVKDTGAFGKPPGLICLVKTTGHGSTPSSPPEVLAPRAPAWDCSYATRSWKTITESCHVESFEPGVGLPSG